MSRGQVRTWGPGFTRPMWWLGELGPVTGLKHSWTVPGGDEQMSCTLMREPVFRHPALNPGRMVEVIHGGSVAWTGKLDEPQQAQGGWTVTAHGAGTWAGEWDAIYTTWTNQNDAVNQAVSRGLPWVNPGITSSVYLGQPVDSGSVKLDALLNTMCSRAALTWWVGQWRTLTVTAIPSVVNRLLVCAVPTPRTLAGDINVIILRYQSSLDGSPLVYATTEVGNLASIAAYGRIESYEDVSSAGHQTAAAVQGLGNAVLAKYQRASYAGPFDVAPGQLLTVGGQPVDLAVQDPGMVCQLVLLDAGYGGEVAPGRVTFPVGRLEYDDDTGTAQVTPWASPSLSGLVAARALSTTLTAAAEAHALAVAKAKAAAAARHTAPRNR